MELGNVIQEFQMLIDSMKDLNSIITGENKQKREKRAAIPQIGDFIEDAFGNPSEETMKKLVNELNRIKETGEQISVSLYNQTLLTEKIIKIIRENVQKH